jgi:hypothetical protein
MSNPIRCGMTFLLLAAVLTGCGKPAISGPSPIATLDLLRPLIAETESGRWVERLEVAVTGRFFPVVGLGMKLTSVDPRIARLVRGASEVAVRVYERRSGPVAVKLGGLPTGRLLLDTVSERLVGLEWERVVGVRDGEQTVAVFLPAGWDGLGDVTCCVLVRGARELVMVSARMDPRPLIELAREMDLPGLPAR